jgi:hypothetical protein
MIVNIFNKRNQVQVGKLTDFKNIKTLIRKIPFFGKWVSFLYLRFKLSKRSLRLQIKRLSSTPFVKRREQKLILHCCHHRVGTVWFQPILMAVASKYGLNFQSGWAEWPEKKPKYFYNFIAILT